MAAASDFSFTPIQGEVRISTFSFAEADIMGHFVHAFPSPISFHVSPFPLNTRAAPSPVFVDYLFATAFLHFFLSLFLLIAVQVFSSRSFRISPFES